MTSRDALDHLASRPLLRSMAEHWWLMLLRGIAAVAFGILSLVWPAISALSLVLLWGAYSFADGIFSLGAAIMGKAAPTQSRWWLAVTGVLGIAAGLIAFFAPAVVGGVLLIFIAIWAIAIGVMAIVGAIQLRKEIEGEWLLILSRRPRRPLRHPHVLPARRRRPGRGLDDRHLRHHLRHRPDLLAFKLKGYKDRA